MRLPLHCCGLLRARGRQTLITDVLACRLGSEPWVLLWLQEAWLEQLPCSWVSVILSRFGQCWESQKIISESRYFQGDLVITVAGFHLSRVQTWWHLSASLHMPSMEGMSKARLLPSPKAESGCSHVQCGACTCLVHVGQWDDIVVSEF